MENFRKRPRRRAIAYELDTIGGRLAYARVQAGFRQDEAGDMVDLTQTAVSEIERNRNQTSWENLVVWTDAYNVNPRWVVTGQGAMALADSPMAQIPQAHAHPSTN